MKKLKKVPKAVMRLVPQVDLTNPRTKVRFRRWKKHDGTAKGLAPLVVPARLPNWDKKLATFIEAQRNRPFEWGQNDCCLFSCNMILEITGADPAADVFRGKYDSALGAGRLLSKHGGVEKIASRICDRLGFGEIRITFASRGDVVLLVPPGQTEPVLGVCLGALSAFVSPEGLKFVHTVTCSRAWKVGGNR
jgi:hypothetical protein